MGKSTISINIFNSKLLVITKGYPISPGVLKGSGQLACFCHFGDASTAEIGNLLAGLPVATLIIG